MLLYRNRIIGILNERMTPYDIEELIDSIFVVVELCPAQCLKNLTIGCQGVFNIPSPRDVHLLPKQDLLRRWFLLLSSFRRHHANVQGALLLILSKNIAHCYLSQLSYFYLLAKWYDVTLCVIVENVFDTEKNKWYCRYRYRIWSTSVHLLRRGCE